MTLTAPPAARRPGSFAPTPPGVWDRGVVHVRRDRNRLTGSIVVQRNGDDILVRHNLTGADLSDSLVGRTTSAIADTGGGRAEFEATMVGLVRTTIDDPSDAWTAFYRNSMDELCSGAAPFAPVHDRAIATVVGSVLDLGSCFGFFPLRMAAADPSRTVVATDLHADTMALLDAVAPRLGVTIDTVACDAAALPFPDASFDTVTALHLLEHVDRATGHRVLTEACRVARQRVIVAVPYEAEPAACHGHVRTFDRSELHCAGLELGHEFLVTDHHGGWLTIDVG
ncbi:mycofactocin oligosaccharide methyltransferase MftM [Williamsia phyllosphaerae]|uniref:mycofactocin oligosaccharide methyltransferase MftM n=1 Tax=Williamsia phyllosphaerae TaxID=885042 RepID=UPI001666DD21|nr:mycofactocin oligosaccharide methyltransferase MftM [Williamsia phyllosphaerae]